MPNRRGSRPRARRASSRAGPFFDQFIRHGPVGWAVPPSSLSILSPRSQRSTVVLLRMMAIFCCIDVHRLAGVGGQGVQG